MTDKRVPRCANTTGRGVAFSVVSVACWLALCHGAHALDTCTGSYSASLVHPLPSPNVVQLQNVKTEIGDRFVTGLRRAGVVTTGRPTTRLDIVSMVIPAEGIVSRHPGSYHGFGWALDTSPTADSVVSSTLQVNMTLTNIQTMETNWIASLSCKILTKDKGRTVQSIGELLGRAVGKNLDPTQF